MLLTLKVEQGKELLGITELYSCRGCAFRSENVSQFMEYLKCRVEKAYFICIANSFNSLTADSFSVFISVRCNAAACNADAFSTETIHVQVLQLFECCKTHS